MVEIEEVEPDVDFEVTTPSASHDGVAEVNEILRETTISEVEEPEVSKMGEDATTTSVQEPETKDLDAEKDEENEEDLLFDEEDEETMNFDGTLIILKIIIRSTCKYTSLHSFFSLIQAAYFP